MKKDVWDSQVPVEKSPYIQEKDISYINLETASFTTDKPYMIDLFCGAGGFSVGCSWAGFEPVFGIDYFKPAIKTWTRNHKNAIGCLGDIRKIDPLYVLNILREKGINKITLLTGGVPCQGFTIANRKHNDFDERNFLYLEYMRFVKVISPDFIVLENVGGMRSTAGGHFEKQILEHMSLLGYEAKVKVLNAADFGVPQHRLRLLFVGVKRTLKYPEFFFPEGEFTPETYRTVNDAFSDLPFLEAGQEKTEYEKDPQNTYQRILRGFDDSINIKIPDRLYNHIAPNHPQSTIKLIDAAKQGEPMYSTFRQRIRLSLNEPSPTQLAGGIRPSFQFGHPVEPRGLTTRERARIQSFPDNYVFEGGIVQERVQTGNAIPPFLAFAVAKSIKETMKKQ